MQISLNKCLKFMLFYNIPITIRLRKLFIFLHENVAFSTKKLMDSCASLCKQNYVCLLACTD